MHEIETVSFAEPLEVVVQLRRIAAQRNKRLEAEYRVIKIAMAAAIGKSAIGQELARQSVLVQSNTTANRSVCWRSNPW